MKDIDLGNVRAFALEKNREFTLSASGISFPDGDIESPAVSALRDSIFDMLPSGTIWSDYWNAKLEEANDYGVGTNRGPTINAADIENALRSVVSGSVNLISQDRRGAFYSVQFSPTDPSKGAATVRFDAKTLSFSIIPDLEAPVTASFDVGRTFSGLLPIDVYGGHLDPMDARFTDNLARFNWAQEQTREWLAAINAGVADSAHGFDMSSGGAFMSTGAQFLEDLNALIDIGQTSRPNLPRISNIQTTWDGTNYITDYTMAWTDSEVSGDNIDMYLRATIDPGTGHVMIDVLDAPNGAVVTNLASGIGVTPDMIRANFNPANIGQHDGIISMLSTQVNDFTTSDGALASLSWRTTTAVNTDGIERFSATLHESIEGQAPKDVARVRVEMPDYYAGTPGTSIYVYLDNLLGVDEGGIITFTGTRGAQSASGFLNKLFKVISTASESGVFQLSPGLYDPDVPNRVPFIIMDKATATNVASMALVGGTGTSLGQYGVEIVDIVDPRDGSTLTLSGKNWYQSRFFDAFNLVDSFRSACASAATNGADLTFDPKLIVAGDQSRRMHITSLAIGSGTDRLDLVAFANAMGYDLLLSSYAGQLTFGSSKSMALTLPANELIDAIQSYQEQHSGEALSFDFKTGKDRLALAYVDTTSLASAAPGSGLIRYLDLCDGVEKVSGIFDATTASIIDTNIMYHDPKALPIIDALLGAVRTVGNAVAESIAAMKLSGNWLSESSNGWAVEIKFMDNDKVMRLRGVIDTSGAIEWTFCYAAPRAEPKMALSLLDSETFTSGHGFPQAAGYYDNNFAHVSDIQGHPALYFHEWCGANDYGTFPGPEGTTRAQYDSLVTLQNWFLFMNKVPSPVLYP